jgi:Amt family ammonium transporter
MSFHKKAEVLACALGIACVSAGSAWAQNGTSSSSVGKPCNAADSGSNAWMLTASALVLLMTAPGLAMFYSGLVRKKNVLGVIMQCVFLMGMLSIVWALWGYSLAFGGSGKFIGNLDHLFLNGVKSEWRVDEDEPYYDANRNGKLDGAEPFEDKNGNGKWDDGEPFTDSINENGKWDDAELYEDLNKSGKHDKYTGNYTPAVNNPTRGAIPTLTYMLFQGMFFIITPALICGAFAERMKFSTMAVFLLLWGTFVYCPLAHWVWGGGILAYVPTGGQGWAGGALDFAGGTVVHISSGVSALICALLIGKRLGYGVEDMRPHNMTYTALGAALLWVGWFGFNAGSQLGSDGIAASAFAATHFAAAAGGLVWAALEWQFRDKPSVLGMCSGLVAGLVCITPASGYVTPMPAILIGAAAGAGCFTACTWLKGKFKYDDALDAFGVHGVGGTLGALLTGVFATRAVSNLNNGEPMGVVDGGWSLLGGQIVAVVVTWVFAGGMTLILLKILDNAMGLRVTQEEEVLGLDVTQHGEEGYIFT